MNQFFEYYTPYKTPFEGDTPKWLVVCNNGVLRSATIARVVQAKLGFNTRACGTDQHALVPLTLNLIHWADVVVFVDKEVYRDTVQAVKTTTKQFEKSFEVWDIPDRFQYMEPELVDMVMAQLL